MNYHETAQKVLNLVGGKENIQSVTHCATRLRMVAKDDNKVQLKELEKLEMVEAAFINSGQLQLIIGQGKVNKVYKELIELSGLKETDLQDTKKAAMEKVDPFQRFARVLSNIFVPIIPAIVASGLLMGTLGMIRTFGWVSPDSSLVFLLDMFSNAAFVFLPILIAFSAAKEFGTNPFVAAALGGILIHPALQNAWTIGGGIEKTLDFFGINIALVGYQGTVLPILIAVWAMGYVERFFRKTVPNMLDIILTPFLTLLTTAFLSLIIIGPAGRIIGDLISQSLQGLYNLAGPIAGIVFGGLYSTIVITGIHHSFHAVEMGLLANPSIGVNFLLPIWAMANVAQGGAALAVYFKTQNPKIKQVAIPAATSCLLGITEAAIFGVNLRLKRPFIAAAIGGALGGGYVVLTNTAMTAVGLTGIPGTAIVLPEKMIHYIIGMAIAFFGAFIAVNLLGFQDEETAEGQKDSERNNNFKNVGEINEQEIIINSPIKGEMVNLNEVPDKTFAEGILGQGFAINPFDGKVYSPVDGKVMMAFETGHAVAINSSGAELLIHFGIDTVKLGGEGFKLLVNNGDEVKVGTPLLEVDLDKIKDKVPSVITPVVITNSGDFIIEKIYTESTLVEPGKPILKLVRKGS
ncbi:sucrose-specific PTS transporter subunit IIBC [Anaerobranca californiensis]|nr:sucrose-specific PTS transporter subunit IIBC [Anaerobranca californiensis]